MRADLRQLIRAPWMSGAGTNICLRTWPRRGEPPAIAGDAVILGSRGEAPRGQYLECLRSVAADRDLAVLLLETLVPPDRVRQRGEHRGHPRLDRSRHTPRPLDEAGQKVRHPATNWR
ncbi:MAG TPA: hypothetical protein VGR24_07820 [bacterium]|nr:hypothetical protein [bacterium]